jgi:AcrR family transcriptional regulator
MATSSQLRDRQKAATRDQIIEAVHALLQEEHPSTLSMPQVAERAGTSLRTVYRYFPTKEALVDAASESFRLSADIVGGEVDVDNLPDYLTQVWSGFSKQLGPVRAQHATPAGRSLRDARLPRNRATVRDTLRRRMPDLPDADVDRLVDLIVALISSTMYLELVDHLGHDDQDAARLAAWTVRAVVERAAAEGGVAR